MKFYNTFDVAWEFSASVDAAGDPVYVDAGTSHNRMYVVLDDPDLPYMTSPGYFGGVTIPMWETLVHLGTVGAEGTSNVDDAIVGVWNQFGTNNAPTDVSTVGLPVGGLAADQPVSHELSYYEDYRCSAVTSEALLRTHDGQCGSWAELFINTLQSQGINQSDEYVEVRPLDPADDGFIVQDWDFSAIPSGAGTHPWENSSSGVDSVANLYAPPSYNSYAWLPGPDVTDDTGVPGQNTANPASIFNNHQFVRLTVAGDTKYYDPSYGVEYSSIQDLDDSYLAGFYFSTYDAVTDVSTWHFRKNVIGTLELDDIYRDY